MRAGKLKFFVTVAAFAVLLGCSKKPERQGPPRSVRDLEPNELLFSANGEKYTRERFDQAVDLRMALMLNRKPNMPEKKLGEARRHIEQSILSSAVSSILIDQEARKTLPEADAETVRNLKSRYARSFGSRGQDFNALRATIAGQKDGRRLVREFDATFAREARAESFYKSRFADAFKITEARVDEVVLMMAKENAQANATNAIIYARATNVWIQAKWGADFAKLADRFSEEKGRNPGGDLGECDANDFEVEKQMDGSNPVWDAVRALKDGEVSDLMSTSEGLTVYKCLKRIAKSENTDMPAWHLARIVFHRAMLYPEMDREELKATLAKNKREEVLQKFFSGLHDKATFEFPNGCLFMPGAMKRIYMKYCPEDMRPKPRVAATNRPPQRVQKAASKEEVKK